MKSQKEQRRATESNEKQQEATKSNKKQQRTSELEKPRRATKAQKVQMEARLKENGSLFLVSHQIVTAFDAVNKKERTKLLKLCIHNCTSTAFCWFGHDMAWPFGEA